MYHGKWHNGSVEKNNSCKKLRPPKSEPKDVNSFGVAIVPLGGWGSTRRRPGVVGYPPALAGIFLSQTAPARTDGAVMPATKRIPIIFVSTLLDSIGKSSRDRSNLRCELKLITLDPIPSGIQSTQGVADGMDQKPTGSSDPALTEDVCGRETIDRDRAQGGMDHRDDADTERRGGMDVAVEED